MAETLEPGVRVIDVARRHGVPDSLVSNWRTAARRGELKGFLPDPSGPRAQEKAMTFAPVVVDARSAPLAAEAAPAGPEIIVANVVLRLERGASVERICAIVRCLAAS